MICKSLSDIHRRVPNPGNANKTIFLDCRAIHYMQEDLNVSRLLTDNVGECRAHGNLGAAYFTEGKYQLAKESHNRQLALAQGLQVILQTCV